MCATASAYTTSSVTKLREKLKGQEIEIKAENIILREHL